MNKHNSYIFKRWLESDKVTLSDCYKCWSSAKQNAWHRCLVFCSEQNGTRMRIISSNGFVFSVAFLYREGNDLYLSHITRDGVYKIKLDQEAVDELKARAIPTPEERKE